MLFVGWGKKAREIGYAGIEKCPNCRNWTHFALFETKRKVTLYFVPVASWDAKTYLVCGVCEAAWELDSGARSETLAKSATLPPRDQAEVIWNATEAALVTALKAHPDQPEAAVESAKRNLYAKYIKQWVDYVMARRLAALVDANPPA